MRYAAGSGRTPTSTSRQQVLVAPLVNLRRAAWTYGRPPLGLDDERLLSTWVDMCAHMAGSLGPTR
jgi:hypothetical protein